MEKIITQEMILYLLSYGFCSKKALALHFDIPYRTLLKASGPDADLQTAIEVTRCLVRGCIAQRIPIEQVIMIS